LADAGLGTFFDELGRGERYSLIPGVRLPIPTPDAYEAFRAANLDDFTYDEAGSRSNSVEDDYTLNEEIAAYYAMASTRLTPRATLIGGVRVEETEVDVSAFSFVNGVSTNNGEDSRVDELPFGTSDILDISRSFSYTNVLPAVILKWDIDESWVLRSSVSTNIGRPDYPDTAPISSLSVTEIDGQPGSFIASNEIGNPELEPFEGTNFDVSADYYFADNSGLFSAGLFYKRIENAIYQFNVFETDFEFAGVVFDEYFASTMDAQAARLAAQ